MRRTCTRGASSSRGGAALARTGWRRDTRMLTIPPSADQPSRVLCTTGAESTHCVLFFVAETCSLRVGNEAELTAHRLRAGAVEIGEAVGLGQLGHHQRLAGV